MAAPTINIAHQNGRSDESTLMNHYYPESIVYIRAHSRCCTFYGFVVVQFLSRIWLFAIPWTAACQASLSVTKSWPIWIPFIAFSALIAVAKTSRTMFKSTSESGHPCLVSDFRGNAFNFSPLRTMFAVSVSYIAFIMLRYVPSIPAFWRVYHKWMLNFVKGFLFSYWDNHMAFIF